MQLEGSHDENEVQLYLRPNLRLRSALPLWSGRTTGGPMLLKEPATEVNSAPLSRPTSASESLHALLDHHAAFLGFVQRRVQDRALAEDILQSAYVRALQRADTVRDRSAIVPWFYSVLRNAIIDHARSRQSENGALERWAVELE